MKGTAHMAIGGAIGIGIATASPEMHWAAIPTGVIAAGLPDVFDSPHAAGRDTMNVSWRSIGNSLRNPSLPDALIPVRAMVALSLDVISRIIPHRGPTHWLVTCVVLSSLVISVVHWLGGSVLIAEAFALGYLSHLLTDALTKSGVPLFAPFWRKRIHLLPAGLRFRYDSPVQWVVVLAVYAVVWELTGIAGGPQRFLHLFDKVATIIT